MLKLYCQKCGSLHTYGSTKPNFCQKCGNSFREGYASATETGVSESTTDDEELTEESQGGLGFNLSELDVEIIAVARQPDTVGGIAGSAESGAVDQPMIDGEQQVYTAEDFKREAGSIRGGNEAEET